MKVLVFGATGTAGTGILRACLERRSVSHVRVVARRAPADTNEKVNVFPHDDYLDYSAGRRALAGIVQSMLITRHMLFVGFSLRDDNFHQIAYDVRKAAPDPASSDRR